MKASLRPFVALTLAAIAAPALAQVPPSQLAKPAAPAAPPAVNIPGVSAAGNATLTKLQQQKDPVIIQIAQQQQAVAKQIVAAIAGNTVDVEKFAALLKQSEGLTAQLRARADDHVMQALRALSPGDRAPFLRGVVGNAQQKR